MINFLCVFLLASVVFSLCGTEDCTRAHHGDAHANGSSNRLVSGSERQAATLTQALGTPLPCSISTRPGNLEPQCSRCNAQVATHCRLLTARQPSGPGVISLTIPRNSHLVGGNPCETLCGQAGACAMDPKQARTKTCTDNSDRGPCCVGLLMSTPYEAEECMLPADGFVLMDDKVGGRMSVASSQSLPTILASRRHSKLKALSKRWKRTWTSSGGKAEPAAETRWTRCQVLRPRQTT